MSKISAVDFANSVEANRKKLIQHCVENGKEVSSTASLDTVVGVTNTINETQPEGTYKVEFKDIDGSLFAIQYVQAGGDATIPSETPSFDSEYLEFVEWKTSASDPLTNVQRDILALPFYRTKYDETLGQRPTYLICDLVDSSLTPSLYFGSYTNTYINWGDGSSIAQVSSSTVSHTYTNAGQYVITIYGDSYQLGAYSAMFSTSYQHILSKAYIGENCTGLGTQAFMSFYNLTYLVLNSSITSISDNLCTGCRSLDNVVIPNNVTSLGSSLFSGCWSLVSIIIPSSVITFNGRIFSSCISLENITLPDISVFPDYLFSGCYKLKNVNIPNNLTRVGGHCFEKCYNIKKVILPTSATVIGQDAFSSCNSLEDVNIPEGVSSIAGQSNHTFSGCYALKYIKLPSSLRTLDDRTFDYCWGLKFIELPNNFNFTINLQYGVFSDECLIDITNKLQDNTGSSARTIAFNTYVQQKLIRIYLDENGQQTYNGGENLLTIMQNKNWTVSFSNVSPS